MRKIICVVLAVFMLVTMCGCQQILEDIASLNDALLEQNGTGNDVEVEEDEGPEFTPGEFSGNVYTNELADITYTLPENWVFGTVEEMAEMSEISVSYYNGDDAAEKLAEVPSVYCMLAASDDEFSDVQFVIDNTELTGNDRVTALGYVKILSLQIEGLYAQEGAVCEASEVQTVKIGGNEYSSAVFNVEMEDVNFQQSILCRRVDKYMITITMSAFGESGIADILSCFE